LWHTIRSSRHSGRARRHDRPTTGPCPQPVDQDAAQRLGSRRHRRAPRREGRPGEMARIGPALQLDVLGLLRILATVEVGSGLPPSGADQTIDHRLSIPLAPDTS
jgi:hypothetical protein